ncbi:MAG: pyruvate kinase [Deltaproteobacteria bacterium]|nr:pyruvate kinase [Deltaproteobacteria bacterium]
MRKVKIVCTLGPATAGVERLEELIRAGMDVARLNFSHGDQDTHRRTYQDVRAAAKRVGKPVGILADLSGPKIRVGKMQDGAVTLVPGKAIVLTTEPVLGTADRVSHTYAPLASDVRVGDTILLDDGLLRLTAKEIKGTDVVCEVVVGGTLKDKKGMNLPGSPLSTPALTEKDKADIMFGKELGVDFFALSFVRKPEDLIEAKALAGSIPVIAKVEKPEAVERLDAILDASDGVMVARGDLGVEAGHEKVPVIQKRILRAIMPRAIPAITATQMLESMINNPVPTRAEVSDVANAVLDGTDAVMLSGETSVGKYPVEAVKTLAAVIEEVEASSFQVTALLGRDGVHIKSYSHAIADAAAEIDKDMGLAAIAVYTESGFSATLLSAHRPSASVVAFSRHEYVLNRLALYWGVQPRLGGWVQGIKGVVDQAEKSLLQHRLVKPGDDIAVSFGMVLDQEEFQTNVLKLWKVRG